MPFVKIKYGKNKDKYKSPSGKVWTKKEMEAYYASKRNKK